MKKIVLIGVICTALLACNRDAGCNCNYDLSHHYEPHVTYRHSDATDSVHLYSVMTVVRNHTKVYEKIEPNSKTLDVMYSFDSAATGYKPAIPSATYKLCEDFEARMYEYPLPNSKASSIDQLNAYVSNPPNYHDHKHSMEKKDESNLIHYGVVHKPGIQ